VTARAADGPLLMTPGPTRVPDRVLRAGARPMIHHRSPEMSRELATAVELLAPVFGTRNTPLPVHTTGRGALEATICNLFSPGDEIAVCCNGKFGEMWAGFAESYGVVVHRFSTDWKRDADASELEQLLAAHPSVRAAALAFVDTSTGVANDVNAIARVARAHGALVLVDGIPSIGGMPFEFDEWDVDIAVSASQKCLMSSPGLSWVVVSERGWRAVASSRLPRHYWDFTAIRRTISAPKPETPGTAPVHIILQVAEALRMMHEEGLASVYDRHDAMARRVRDGVAELGLSMQCPALEGRAATMTAVALPPSVEPRALRDALKARGIWTAAGLGPFERIGFRIGHMGDIRMDDVERTLSAMREVLAGAASGPAPATVSAR
jgi:aspartate aminotransferase-like enzyme